MRLDNLRTTKMVSQCKGVCLLHKEIFVKNSKLNRLGIEVFYCRGCALFLKIKEALRNFGIFKKFKKGFCDCCGTRLRKKPKTKKQKVKYWRINNKNVDNRCKPELHKLVKCKCGCGEEIPYISIWYNRRHYVKGHWAKTYSKRVRSQDRECLLCNSKTSMERKDRPGSYYWKKYLHGYICKNCSDRLKYDKVRKKKRLTQS